MNYVIKKYRARRVDWSILLALGARDSDSNSGGPISSNFVKCVKKHELESYVRFRQLEELNKDWLYQVELFIKNYLSFCSWKISKEKTLKYLNEIQSDYSEVIKIGLQKGDLIRIDNMILVKEN